MKKIKSITKNIILSIAMLVLVIDFHSCSKIDTANSDNTNQPQTISSIISDLVSVFETVEHISSYYSNLGLRKTYIDSLQKQLNAHIRIVDSTYADGNGISYFIEFQTFTGSLNSKDYSYDQKARYGKIKVSTDIDYRELKSQTLVEIDSAFNFCIGRESMQPLKIIGSFNISRNQIDKETLKFANFKLTKGDQMCNLNGEMSVNWVLGLNTPGIMGDQMQFGGNGILKLDNQLFNWNTTLLLEKDIENGCSANIVKGIIQILDATYTSSAYSWRVDFDPFNNRSCDDIAKVYFAGKEVEYHVK